MAEHSAIEWTDATFNPWWGCQKVSPACDHCYAERDAKRYQPSRVLWGVGAERRVFGEKHWNEPLRWARTMPAKLGRRPRVFCASMADWLDVDEFVRLLDTIRRTPELDWLLLSKRIGNWRKRITEAVEWAEIRERAPEFFDLLQWLRSWLDGTPPAHVWMMATVVTQEEADRDIAKLLAGPARVRGVSIEPMLGAVWLGKWLRPGCMRHGASHELDGKCDVCEGRGIWGIGEPLAEHEKAPLHTGLHWVIAGGESGPHARPMHPDWARSLRDQCAAAGVPFLFKQWGEWAPAESVADDDERLLAERWIRADGSEPPRGAGVDFFGGDEVLYRAGKKAAGRLLDGRTHDEFPLTKLKAAEKEAREPSLFPPT